MGAAAALCFLLGVFPGPVVDLLGGAVGEVIGTALPAQGRQGWLSLVPAGPEAGSYDGLVLLVFIAVSGLGAAYVVHRLASDRTRRAPAWDCGFPEPSPATQYTASSFAQPLRRVFGGYAFLAREEVDMPAPGRGAAGASSGCAGATSSGRAATRRSRPGWPSPPERLNALQFLTIRRYLSLVFGALVLLLLVVATWR